MNLRSKKEKGRTEIKKKKKKEGKGEGEFLMVFNSAVRLRPPLPSDHRLSGAGRQSHRNTKIPALI